MRTWNREYWFYLTEQFRALTKDLKSKLMGVVAGRVMPSADLIPIGSARKVNAAVLFFDIRGSSNRSGLVALYTLDVVIPMVMRIVHDHDGYIEKNTGDGVMAIFTGGDEQKASKAALESAMVCFSVLRYAINPHLIQVDLPSVDVRIGIDFGEILVARIGVPQGSARQDRSFLTAIGHAANIACRLQEQADTNQIWVGDALRLRAPQDWQRSFNRVFPTEWTWISSGTTNPYPAWHFDAVLPEIQRLPFASTILTGLRPLPSAGLLLPPPSTPSGLAPQNSILAALLKGKRLS
jgi:class 3 adenylate cyclase